MVAVDVAIDDIVIIDGIVAVTVDITTVVVGGGGGSSGGISGGSGGGIGGDGTIVLHRLVSNLGQHLQQLLYHPRMNLTAVPYVMR